MRAMHDLGLDRGRIGFDELRLAQSVRPPGAEVVDAYGALKYVRQVKTPEELSLLRTATHLNQLAIVLANAPDGDQALYMHAGPEDFVVERGTHIMWDCHGTWEHQPIIGDNV